MDYKLSEKFEINETFVRLAHRRFTFYKMMQHLEKAIERKEDRFSWPLLSERTKIFEKTMDIEPGEKDVIDFEFVLSSRVETIRIYSFFRNEQKTKGKDEVGWSISTYYDFREPTAKGPR